MATQGLFMDPQAAADARLMQLAQMDPNQRLFLQAARGGQQLGQGVGSLFGQDVRDPAVVRATKMRELAAKYGTTTAEGLDNIAMELQATDPNMAMQIKMQADDLRSKSSKLALEQARTKSLTSGVGKLNPQDYTAESWAKFSDSGDLSDLRNKTGKGAVAKSPVGTVSPKDYTPESIQAFMQSVQSGTPDYSLLDEKVKQKDEKELPSSLVTKVAEADQKISTLNSSINKITTVGSRIDNLSLNVFQNFARGGLAALGVNTKDRLDFDAARRLARKEANNLLLLAKGTQTEGDAQRAADQIADDNTWKNKDALKAAFQDLKDTHADTLEALKASRNTLTSQGKTSAPAPAPAAPTQAPRPPAAGGGDNEAKIQKFMAANPRMTREQVVSNMKRMGFLPANF